MQDVPFMEFNGRHKHKQIYLEIRNKITVNFSVGKKKHFAIIISNIKPISLPITCFLALLKVYIYLHIVKVMINFATRQKPCYKAGYSKRKALSFLPSSHTLFSLGEQRIQLKNIEQLKVRVWNHEVRIKVWCKETASVLSLFFFFPPHLKIQPET